MTAKDLTRISIAAVIIAVCAWLSIPAAVPFTLQTFGIFCALLILGGRNGSLAVLLYILLGAVGLPVFSGFRGGIAAITGPTGGYIIGFMLIALIYWGFEKRLPGAVLLIMGNIVCCLFGTLWFCQVYSGSASFTSALLMCVVPYIIPDALKLLLALAVSRRVRKSLNTII